MTINRSELRRLCEAATPGPWVFTEENVGLMLDHGYGLLHGEADYTGWEKNLYISVGCSGNVRNALGEGAGKANAAFIAAARTALPALLNALEAAEAEAAKMRAAWDSAYKQAMENGQRAAAAEARERRLREAAIDLADCHRRKFRSNAVLLKRLDAALAETAT